jgi:hypothetical protein
MITISNDMLADYLVADFGSRLIVRADDSYEIINAGTSLRGMSFAATARCPGIGNLDSGWFSRDFADLVDGIYRGDGFEGDLEALIRYSCEHGDMSDYIKDLTCELETSIVTPPGSGRA